MGSVFTTKDGAIVWHGVASDPACFAFARKSSNIFPLELQIGKETKTSQNGGERIDMSQEIEVGEEEATCDQLKRAVWGDEDGVGFGSGRFQLLIKGAAPGELKGNNLVVVAFGRRK